MKSTTIITDIQGEFTVQYEQGDQGDKMFIGLQCAYVPLGSVVSFDCPAPGPNPRIHLDPTTVTATPYFNVGIMSYVPAYFSGLITIKYDIRGNVAPGMTITFFAVTPVTMEDKEQRQVVLQRSTISES